MLFLIDNFTFLDIKSQKIKSFAYFGIVFYSPVTLIWNLWNSKLFKWKIINSVFPLASLIIIFIIGPFKIMLHSSAWKTQEIIFNNLHSDSKKIEFQMQDLGTFGYNKRTVDVTYLTKHFMIIKQNTPIAEDEKKWIRVNKEINELKLKLP